MTSDKQKQKNLEFYNIGREVPKEACRSFVRAGGFSGTDINRMWRIRTLTEMFGPCGIGWTFELVELHERQLEDDDRTVLFGKGELIVRDPETGEWSRPIIGYGGNEIVKVNKSGGVSINDEAYKMVETDAFGSACSKLGIGASVYWSSEVSKYEVEQSEPANPRIERKNRQTAERPVDPNGSKYAIACKKAIEDWVSEDILVNVNHEVLQHYVNEYGVMANWKPGTNIQCYKELKDAGIKLKEVE